MTFGEILGTLFIEPLKLIFEIVFEYAYRFVNHYGLSIIFLSLIMNILVFPLYRRADAMQEAIRDIETKLHPGVVHIKRTFSGDERMMILGTYYRQNHYKPTDALKGSMSLLLEIPFFIAAYQFLSNLDVLRGVSFGPIKDLGAPDGLLVLGSVTINLLPILMTLINVVSSALYLKGFPLKTKIQLYAMAFFFLFFLYSSPSCLLFYWTLNNIFSLIKNIFYKLKNPQRILRFLTAVTGMYFLMLGVFFYHTDSLKRKLFLIGVGGILLIPLVWPFLKRTIFFSKKTYMANPDRKIFLLGSVFLTFLVGLLIPSVFIAASPQEFVDVICFYNPLWYIVQTFCYSAGTFLIWMRVFYELAGSKGKVFFEKLVWIVSGIMLVNYLFFGTDLGNLSVSLQYDNGVFFTFEQQLCNLFVLIIVAAVMYFLMCRWRQVTGTVLMISAVALAGMSMRNIAVINASVSGMTLQGMEGTPHFKLSKTGKNVIVLMLDRAMGEYVPYMFNEKPELKEQFAGFTYYENTISFGAFTNFGVPALLGGYEYTPVEMNRRSGESLVSKHNESLKVMPVLFWENGYETTVCDPTYANYQWVPDLTVFSDYPEIKTYITKGQFGDIDQKQNNIKNIQRNFFCFSIMKTMPVFIQPNIYENGQYHKMHSDDKEIYSSPQERNGISVSNGVNDVFMEPYYVLTNLSNITKITEEDINTYLFLSNDTTHEPQLLQEPDYIPAQNVNNTEYDKKNKERFILNGKKLKTDNENQMIHYQANMAAFLQLGRWFDYLRENEVYDNTRIILVADHARYLEQMDELILDDGTDSMKDAETFFPLLMMKDFGSEEFVTSDAFMTNADVPTLAMENLIQNPQNPFTGKIINSDEKYAHDQFIIMSWDGEVNVNDGNTFLPARWASVKDNLWDKNNWTFYDQNMVLDEYSVP